MYKKVSKSVSYIIYNSRTTVLILIYSFLDSSQPPIT